MDKSRTAAMEPLARGNWTLEQLKNAMDAVKEGVMSQRKASRTYGVPRRTLVNHLKSGKVEKQIGRRTVLTAEHENDLALRIKRLASIGFPLTPKIIRHQAFIFCEKNNIPNKFNQSTKRAGKDWLKLFLKRHPDISKRKVQILNPGRAQKLNKIIVAQHFKEYKKIYETLKIRDYPQRLFNMDEKGCRLTIHKQPIVLAKKGSKRVHMVAPEHAENVTVAACVNALGNPIPPMIIFKGKRLKPEYNDNLPAGSLVKMAPKGSMTSSLFVDFIHHLGKYKPEGQCLLVFDGASCHLDYNIVDAADDENIILYCLPSNTTHELQPLDKSVNKSFEHYWDQETLSFLYQYPDKKLTKARFNSIFRKVWSKCMTHENIVSGFRATGLYPYNPEAVPDEAYAPSVLTERPPEQEQVFTGHISPTPGKAHINVRHGIYRADSSDSNQTYFNRIPCSPSLLQQTESIPFISDTYRHINKKIVAYSSTDTDSEKLNLSVQVKKPITIIRPIIYSSNSETSFDEALIPRQRPLQNFESIHNIYSSSDDENKNPGFKQQHTPIKQMNIPRAHVDVKRRDQHLVSSDDDSEDDIPLERLKIKNSSTKSPFQQLIPTPNYAVVKQKPRRKAINYKARIVTKDLFTEREKKKENLKRKMKENDTQKIENKRKKLKTESKKKTCCKNKKRGSKTKTAFRNEDKMQKTKTSKSDKRDDNIWYCYACHTESCEDMRQCLLCQKWFHEQCLGLTKEDLDFDCPICN